MDLGRMCVRQEEVLAPDGERSRSWMEFQMRGREPQNTTVSRTQLAWLAAGWLQRKRTGLVILRPGKYPAGARGSVNRQNACSRTSGGTESQSIKIDVPTA